MTPLDAYQRREDVATLKWPIGVTCHVLRAKKLFTHSANVLFSSRAAGHTERAGDPKLSGHIEPDPT